MLFSCFLKHLLGSGYTLKIKKTMLNWGGFVGLIPSVREVLILKSFFFEIDV